MGIIISENLIECVKAAADDEESSQELINEERLMGIIISENLIECVKAAADDEESSQELINEAVNLLVKSK